MTLTPRMEARLMRVSAPRPRVGFTLVELMVVIMILGILIALLLPAINGAVRTARDATVTAEINQMATALADFKSKYNKYPPSRLILREDGIYSLGITTMVSSMAPNTWVGLGETFPPTPPAPNDISYGELSRRSLQFFKSTWSRAYFVEFRSATETPSVWQHDFNGNNVFDEGSIYLEGHECLVFFLGGIPISITNGGPGVSGFANSPTKPFQNSNMVTNRTAPMMEFKTSRLVDNDNDGMFGYVDSLGSGPDVRYYAYFSNNSGGGYDPHDVNFTSASGEIASDDVGSRPFVANNRTVISAVPNPYTTSLPTQTPTTTYVSKDSYQIISAGRDGLYGPGGQYSPNDLASKLPGDNFIPNGQRQGEQDNLTSFATGHID